MPAAGNAGNSVRADKAQAKAKKLKRKPVATGSRGDSGSKLVKPSKPIVAHAPGPPNFPRQIPVRPGAATPKHGTRKGDRPSTQAERTHVHKERIKRNIELAPGKAYVSTGKAVEAAANKANAQTQAQAGLKGSLAKKYAKKNPDIFNAKTKGELKTAGFTADQGVRLSTNAYKDLLAIGQTPVSTYHLAEPAVSALAHGDTKKAGKEALKAGKAVAKPYTELALHPRKSFMKHPVFTPLMFAGAEGAVGRVAGSTARSGALGAAAKAAASTERTARVVEGTSLGETKKYSPDVIRKGAQRFNEKRKVANDQLRVKRGLEPKHPNPARMTEQEINRRVDERISANEDIRRQNRDTVVHQTHQALKGAEHPATALVAQGIVKADKADLQAYIHELEARHPHLKPPEKHANAKLRGELQKVVDGKHDMSKARKAADKYEKIIASRESGLVEHGMINEPQSLRAKLIPHAIRNMEAKHEPEHWVDSKGTRVTKSEVDEWRRLDPEAARAEFTKVPAQMVTKDGETLTTAAMLKHYQAHHDTTELPSFVTHRERKRGNWNVRSEYAPSVGTGVRTGKATREGLFDTSHEALVENAARVQGLKDAADGFNGIVEEFGVKGDNGKITQFGSHGEAKAAAKEMRFDSEGDVIPGGHNMVPINLKPFGGSKEQLQSLIEKTQGDEMIGTNSPIREAMRAAFSDTGDGSYALIPEQAAKRIQEHLSTMGRTTFEQAFGAGSSLFRKTVLATSPTWLWGNVAEAGMRSVISRSGPMSYLRGQKVMRQLARENPELAQIVSHRVAGGGHFSTAERMQVFKSAEQFHGTSLEPVARKMAKAARAPGAKNIAGAWQAYTSHVFHFNSALERHFQTAMFGRALKRDGYKAIEDAVNGLRNTESQVRLGRMVDDMYGKYGKWSPSARHLIATYTPFVSWLLAATKFVTMTLPKDHPVLTGLLASANVAAEQWRQENKLNLNQLGLKQGFLAGTVPGKGGTHTNIARYGPFGAFTNPTDVFSTILPQASTLMAAGKGQDWKGQDLTAENFGKDLAGAYIPGFQRYQAAKKYGAVQSVNPYRPIKPGKKQGGRAAPTQFKFNQPASSGFDWGGGSSASDGSFDWGG